MHIAIDRMSAGYARNRVLQGITLHLDAFPLAVVGENGTGKTTLLKVIAGVLRITDGSIAMLPTDLTVAYQPPFDIFLPWRTVRGNLDLVDEHLLRIATASLSPKTLDPAWGFFTPLLLADHAEAYPRSLSTGWQQRLNMTMVLRRLDAMARLREPALLLLDEPTRGLDFASKNSLADRLAAYRDRNIAIVCVSHEQAFLQRIGPAATLNMVKMQGTIQPDLKDGF